MGRKDKIENQPLLGSSPNANDQRSQRHSSDPEGGLSTDTPTSDMSCNSEIDEHVLPGNKYHAIPLKTRTPLFIYVLTFFSAIGGFLFGYDTGVISGAMILIRDRFHLNSLWQELIVSVTIGSAALFSIFAGKMNDRFGRKFTILTASFVFMLGAIVMGVAGSKEMLLGGRVVVGIGIGLSSMTIPMYIAESAPYEMRGRLVVINNMFITGGQFVASCIDGAFSYDHTDGWRYMLGLAGVPALIQFIGFIFMPESPRWLVIRGKLDKARHVLQLIRGYQSVGKELQQIEQTSIAAHQAVQEKGQGSVFLEIFRTPHVRKALLLGCCLQMFQQISGINTVMYYSATIIRMSGVRDASSAIWLAAATAFINFIFTLLGVYLVEKIGRRPLTLVSLLGTAISLMLLAIGFQVVATNSPSVALNEPPVGNYSSSCNTYSVCEGCVNNPNCGFCYIDVPTIGVTNGSCLDTLGSDPVMSDYGRCSNSTGLAKDQAIWAYDFCPTAFSWMTLLGLVLYLAAFAPGMGPMPWTINSEIYPLWARSTAVSIATATNWIFNLVISMTFLTLTQTITKYGAFWLYSGLALLGLAFLFFRLPETKGKSLEEVEELFKQESEWDT
ncbi:unnamed protein product [Owenia fusiformis]|uniref:Major facilitator superfamily (MFS) profile domain-containing protein n=1 Tax=Owenia fusiformis TaxID=6347 RepID=A0A8S4NNK2_OWEFU|nr:unnamed protein product [Owenia fusiformis]